MYLQKVNRRLPLEQLETIARIIRDKIFVPIYKKKTTVFLCGADIKDKNTGRGRMADIFSKFPRYELIYPEDLFDDLLAGQGKNSLLDLENILAKSVNAIVIFPESAGSFAELGVFSSNTELAKKMICLLQKKYKNHTSFINYGPNRQVRLSKTGKVMHINYDELTNEKGALKIYRSVNDYITAIKKEHPVEEGVANLLEAENFILPCIYLIENVGSDSLKRLLEIATSQPSVMSEIAVGSAITRLLVKKLIAKTTSGYKVTNNGAIHVRNTFSNLFLDRARVEIMNVENRRNAMIKYDRIVNAAHL